MIVFLYPFRLNVKPPKRRGPKKKLALPKLLSVKPKKTPSKLKKTPSKLKKRLV